MNLLDQVAAHLQAHPDAGAIAVADALRVRRVATVSVMMRMLRLKERRCMVEGESTPSQTSCSPVGPDRRSPGSLIACHVEPEAC